MSLDEFIPLNAEPSIDEPNPFRRDSPPPPEDFERRREESLDLHRSSDVISRVVDRVSAVCRIPGRGSAILVSKMGVREGVLLTTPAVLASAEDAEGQHGVFFEARVLNGLKKLPVCAAALRPDRLFYCSVPESRHGKRQHGLGYVIVGCELYGSTGGFIEVEPLALPLLTPNEVLAEAGGVLLAVQHPNGKEKMQYHLGRVRAVRDHHLELGRTNASGWSDARSDESADHIASGGAVFNAAGRLLGIGHFRGGPMGVSIVIKLGDIVTHMMRNRLLGALRFAVRNRAEYDFNRSPDDDLEDTGGYESDPEVSGGRGIFWEDLWRVWAAPDRLETVVQLLCAFPYNRSIQARGLRELTSHSQRHNIKRLAEIGGIEPAVRALGVMAGEKEVIEAAVLTLGRASESESNQAELLRTQALQAGLQTMLDNPVPEEGSGATRSGAAEAVRIQQWGCFLLLQMMEGPNQEECKAAFASGGGMGAVTLSLQRSPDSPHLVSWAASAVRVACEHSADLTEQAAKCNTPVALLKCAQHWVDGAAPLEAVLSALCVLTDEGSRELRQAVCDDIVAAGGVLQLITSALRRWSSTDCEGGQRPEVLRFACHLAANLLILRDDIAADATDADLEQHAVDAAEACPVSGALLKEACQVCSLLGADVAVRFADLAHVSEVKAAIGLQQAKSALDDV
eukprot:Hpha_TRINITY_DN23123_c0_g1::TRINITY_DN23123_c0_g1_i1::g.29674::m.29674